MPQYKNIAYDTEVINFVINIKTCDVYSIPVFFDTPYEAYRTVFLHDQQEKSDPRAKRYFLAYDQCRATMPGLSSEAIKEIGIFYKHIDYHRDLSIFITQRGYEFFRALSTIRRRDPEVALCTAPILLRYSDKNRLGACYTDSKEAENSAVLQCLNEYMPNNVKFTSKIREYPSHIVDALLACDDWSVAIQYQQYLKDKNIEAHIIYHNTLGLTLCVPGINVSQGRGIGKADERPALKQPWV